MMPAPEGSADDDPIRATVARLARPHRDGVVVERAAILAEGEASGAIVEWIIAHAGRPEAMPAPEAPRGLHGARQAGQRGPRRYVLPSSALSD